MVVVALTNPTIFCINYKPYKHWTGKLQNSFVFKDSLIPTKEVTSNNKVSRAPKKPARKGRATDQRGIGMFCLDFWWVLVKGGM